MSLDLYFIAYEQKPPSASIAEETRMADEEFPKHQFDAARKAVAEHLIETFPEYAFTPSEKGPSLGGVLDCEDCDLPQITFWPSHAMVEMGFRSDPEWSQKTILQIAAAFEQHSFAVYDPENQKIWRAAELGEWLPKAILDEQRLTKEVQDGRVEFHGRTQDQKPWWRFW